jgi:hypothetical protein
VPATPTAKPWPLPRWAGAPFHGGRHDRSRALLEEARAAFEALHVTPGVAPRADYSLALVARATGATQEAARRLLLAFATPEGHWYDDTQHWLMYQVAASIIEDLPTAAMLVGAAAARYEASVVVQSVFLLADLRDTRARLAASAWGGSARAPRPHGGGGAAGRGRCRETGAGRPACDRPRRRGLCLMEPSP